MDNRALWAGYLGKEVTLVNKKLDDSYKEFVLKMSVGSLYHGMK